MPAMPSAKTLVSAAALLAMVQAETKTVTAKENNSFDPKSIQAAEGDTVEFKFEKGNHSVVAGIYAFPCSPLDLGSGFFSGFVDTDNDMSDYVFRVQINDTKPIAFYSSVDNQCPQGMVGMINPDDKETLGKYRDNAAKGAGSVSPGQEAYGGIVKNESTSNDGSNDDRRFDAGGRSAAGAYQIPILGLVVAMGAAAFMA